tara:strand:+ start:5197 stop:5652 length:456 start_codon:yes stop_codon:yes gene_type:complete
MILIAHRGNTEGPQPEKENHPDYIDKAISLGYDVEVDIWGSFDTKLYLGHDTLQYEVEPEWIFKRVNKLWLHAKNIQALFSFSQQAMGACIFWHQKDDYTLTSNGFLWTYPGAILTPKSICVMPEKVPETYNEQDLKNCAGVCSDFISRYK